MFLCLDSCGDQALLVLSDSAGLVTYRTITPKHGEDRVKVFLDSVQDILCSESLGLDQIRQYVVVQGPGRYTGIRLGISFFQGLCLPAMPTMIRRDHAYRNIFPKLTGWLLMESGRSSAYVAYARVFESPTLKSEQDILALSQASDLSQDLVCLLSAKDQYHYQKLFKAISCGGGKVIFPDEKQRAECLSQAAICSIQDKESNTQTVFYGSKAI